MADILDVHLNDDGPDSIDVSGQSFQAAGDFEVVFHNHGQPLHVHLRLEGALSRVATVGAANHYVAEGAVSNVRVRVDEDRLPVEGRLEIVTGYGAETEYVTVEVVEPGAVDPTVEVDERLGDPPEREPDAGVDATRLVPLAIGTVAVLSAIATVLLVSDVVVLALLLVAILGAAVAAALVLA